MAKAKATNTPKAPAATGVVSEETLARLEQGLKPYTLLCGTHYQSEFNAEGQSELAGPYKQGDVVYSAEDLAAKWPDRFVAGVNATVGSVVDVPGLGESVGDAIDSNGYDVYVKNGVAWAYVPGVYGTPASPALMDLVAAEEWCQTNPIA